MRCGRKLRLSSLVVVILLTATWSFAQGTPRSKRTPKAAPVAAGPKVTKIDIEGLKALIKPTGKPRLINFWATWCDPCRAEFPDLVKLHEAYGTRIDFAAVSIDDPADIDTLVPKFLGEMRSSIPAYLLSTKDESAAISLVSKDWAGNLPLTIVFDASGGVAYQLKDKMIRYEAVAAELDKLVPTPATKPLEP